MRGEDILMEKQIILRSKTRWQIIWLQFKRHRVAVVGLWIFGIFILLVVFGDFLIPYSPFKQFEGFNYVPPRPIRFREASGTFRIPFIYGYEQKIDKETWKRTWSEKRDHIYQLRFFVPGFRYKLFGLIPMRIHLFGTQEDEAPLLLFGTDELGMDIFSRTIYATRISLSIAFLGVFVTLVFAIVLGGFSGYYGGVFDIIVQRISELLLSIPSVPLWMALAAAVPTDWSVEKTYLIIVVLVSLLSWPWMARAIRSKIISLIQEDYITAARSYGASNARIVFSYLLPNFMSYLIVGITLAIPDMILFETALSFLGLGLRSPAISWGVLLEEAQNFQTVIIYPWLLYPGIFLVLSILSLNFIGDGIRDAADPYSRR